MRRGYFWITCALLATAAWGAESDIHEFDIKGTDSWLDTKIDLHAQDELAITATGQLTLAKNEKVTAAGAKRGFRDLIRTYPVNEAGQGALIGRVGDGDAARAFLIGTEAKKWTAPKNGRLFLGINKTGTDAPDGSLHVKVEITKKAPAQVSTNYKLPTVTTEMVDRYPRRVQDAAGNPGDNTNFLVVGTEQQVLNAFEAAGWVQVDKSKNDAVLTGIEAVLSRKAYVTLPMSELTLFGRSQDHGLAQADPLQVVAERHHFRIWKAPFQADNSQLWVGAGTHDIGFDRDKRNNGVTHKIDADVDKERDYIGQSLSETGMVAKLDYATPSNPSKEAVTATGATFHSDGRVLVIYLVPEAGSAAPGSNGTAAPASTDTDKGKAPAGTSAAPTESKSEKAPEDKTSAPVSGSGGSLFDGLIPKR